MTERKRVEGQLQYLADHDCSPDCSTGGDFPRSLGGSWREPAVADPMGRCL